MEWLTLPPVVGFWGFFLLLVGLGYANLAYRAPAPPEFAQLYRYEGTVADVVRRRDLYFERTGLQNRRDGWIVRLTDGSEFFVGTPASFDDASSVSSGRTEAALPAGSNVVIHGDDARVWQLVNGSWRLIDYAEVRAEVESGHAQVAITALVVLVLGSLMCWSALKRWWRSP